MKISLGTSNEFKINLLNKVIKEIGEKAEVVGFDVPSGVSDQPIGSLVTKKGAKNRAKRAFEASSGAEIGIGLEVGYEKRRDELFEMMCWGAIYDGKKYYFSKSHGLLMPNFHQKVLKDGKYLGEHVRKFASENAAPAVRLVRDTLIYREPFLKTAAHNVLILYLARNHY